MRLPDQHLNADELEELGKGERLSGELGDQLRPAREHVESCPACQRRLEVYPTSGAKLEKLRAPQGAQKGPDCPPIEIWLQLAGGLLPSAEEERYTAHAATCDYCGPVLREVIRDFEEPITKEEKTALASLKVQDQDQGHSDINAVRMVTPPIVPASRSWWRLLRWQLSAAALVLAVSIATFILKSGVFQSDTVASVNQLTAQAYGEQRTIDLRIPGALYGPKQVKLGPSGSQFSRPQALFDAEAKLKRQLKQSPDDPNWLDSQARAELLDGDFQAAVDTLTRASQIDPESDVIRTDLATAYFERGLKSNFPADCEKAADLLGVVLQKSPKDPTALFNRALVNEYLNLYPQAVEDWKGYLSIDSQGDWAQEAKSHLEKLVKRISEHERNLEQPLSNPSEFVQLAESRSPALIDELERRIEEYQDRAIRSWLGLSAAEDTGAVPLMAALHDLAAMLRERHGDRWLDDLLQSVRSSKVNSGLLHLGYAVLIDDDDGDVNEADNQARAAREDFKDALNEPGILRAKVEEVRALRQGHDARDCLRAAGPLTKRLREFAYPWLAAELMIDQGSCALMLGEFDLAESDADEARQLAIAHGYRDLELRSIGLAAGVKLDEGDLNSAWAEDESGLLRYWSNGFAPPLRAQFFYDELSYLAEDLGEWHAALGFAQESAHMASLARQQKTEALVRRHLAEIAAHAGDFKLASEQLVLSSSLSGSVLSANQTAENAMESKKVDRLYSEIALGEIEIEMGKLDDAGKRLALIEPDVGAIRDKTQFTVPQQFYAVQSNLLLKQHRERESEDLLLQGAELADKYARKISRLPDRYLWTQENSRLYRTLVYLELLKGDSERALATWEWYKAGALGHSHAGATSLRDFWNTDGLRSTLASLLDQTIISYAWLPQGLAIWFADEHGVEGGLANIDSGQLKNWITEFYQLCSDRQSDIGAVRSHGRKLFDLLIAPVAKKLDPHRAVLVESDGVLGELPFQALVTPENTYFGQSFQIGFSPGLLYDDFLHPDSPILSSSAAFVVGSTVNVVGQDISLFPASDVRDHAKEIAAKFIHAIKVIDEQANADVMKSELPKSEVFHYVGHAVSSPEKEGLLLSGLSMTFPSGATLWDSGQIKPELFRRSKLVVLAACSTGRAHGGRTEKYGELVHNILLVGVPHVVASRWDVDSGVTRSFMNLFYSALLAGKPVSAAMHLASNSLLGYPKTQHPYYWAAFASFGRV